MDISFALPIKRMGNTGQLGINTGPCNAKNINWAPTLVSGTRCMKFPTQKVSTTTCSVSKNSFHSSIFLDLFAVGIGLGDMWDAVPTADGKVVYRNSLVVGSGSYATANGRMGYDKSVGLEKN